MATRSARDNKALNARHAETLKAMLRLPENKTCADCKRNDPRWASTNLGCFMCIRCSGIHRSMGVHITRIKSIDLDTWTPEQVATVQRWGNRRANAYWEAHLRPGHMPPDHKIESFIRSKYESKRWVMSGTIPEPETLDSEGDVEPQVNSSPPVPPTSSAPPRRPSVALGKSSVAPPTTSISLIDAPPSSNAGLPTSKSSNTTFTSTKAVPPTSSTSTSTSGGGGGGGLFDLDFSPSASAAAATATAPAARKDVKNDILSLFAVKPTAGYGQAQGPLPVSGHSDLGGLNNQFGGLQMSSANSQTPTRHDPFSSFGNNASTVPQSNTFTSPPAFGFGGSNNTVPPSQSGNLFGGMSDPWANTTDHTQSNSNDGFGNFAVASKSTNAYKPDAFSDIWK